ncbi:MAG: 16S rRNA processing protein RimM [Firmicutes bacterium]|nr:16S rRNA processing protein RimM [Bacillota bacterium]MBQ3112042.1 16S rRNA processing protein RimM [Bacillota bacterium]MBQ6842692.1 16S rRNA processing protein RimM [Bacillota bacterium]MBR7113161.1 16S rRNA processing protein RimM [Bacillota bacterium]
MSDKKSELILVGKLTTPHGLNGAMKMICHSDNPNRFKKGSVVFDAKGSRYTVLSAQQMPDRLLVRFEEVTDRNGAEALRGVELFVTEDMVEPLPEGSYYYYQLLGLTMKEGERVLGKIVDILAYSANDIYVVKMANGKELLVPALKHVIMGVDLENGIMQVELPDGLED